MNILPGRAQPPLGYLRIEQEDARRFMPDPERATLIVAEFGGLQKERTSNKYRDRQQRTG